MGVLAAILIISLWTAHLFYCLSSLTVNFLSPLFYLHILIQGYLFTGLFITAHDAMHRTVSRSKLINDSVGHICCFLFAGLSYNKLFKNHHKHHSAPGKADDPDYYCKSRNFFVWFAVFAGRYITLLQIIIAAVIFNVLKIRFDEISIWFYYVIPSVLGTLQLFYFGTYLPHRTPHTHDMHPHNARTLKKNHLWAMLSCYFFGYHHEHHSAPHIPWWQLYKMK